MNRKLLTGVLAVITAGSVVAYRSVAEEHDHDHEHEKAGSEKHDHEDEHDHDHDHKDEKAEPEKHDHADEHDHEHGHSDEVKLTADAIRLHDIRVAPVAKQALSATFTVPARVAYNAEAIAHIGSAVKGRAIEIKARLGDVVKKGDELIVIESPELGQTQSDYLQKRTSVAIASAAVQPANLAYQRAKELFEKSQGIALGEVQKRESELKAAEGAVLGAQAALDAAESSLRLIGFDEKAIENLGKTQKIDPRFIVRAPIAGTVISRETTLGELVSPDKESLLVTADLGTLWIHADVPESKVGDLRVGSAARVLMSTSAAAAVAGKVSYIDPALDSGSRTAKARIEIANADGALRPGMFARVEFAIGAADAPAVLVIPEQSVQTVEGKPSVFVPVEGEPNTFATRVVEVGRPVGGMVQVVSGLKEGEPVVVNGTFILKADLGKAGAAHEH